MHAHIIEDEYLTAQLIEDRLRDGVKKARWGHLANLGCHVRFPGLFPVLSSAPSIALNRSSKHRVSSTG